MGHDCDDYVSETFKGNVAHSIDDPKGGGYGAIIYPDPSKVEHAKTCFEGSYFSAYKCNAHGATSLTPVIKLKYSFMTSIDNGLGFGPQAASGSFDHHAVTFEINDNKIYGESAIPDCP